MTLTPAQFVERLNSISSYNGVPYGRAQLIAGEKAAHYVAAQKYNGHVALSGGFKCFFLETFELLNSYGRPRIKGTLSEYYGLLIPRLVYANELLCGAEHSAADGYPMQAFSLLRNTFDSIVLTSSALQGLTDMYALEAIRPGQLFNQKQAKALRKDTESAVRKKMTGNDSGLGQTTIDDLKRLNEMFDYEVHGGQLSLTQALTCPGRIDPLHVVPSFDGRAMAGFMNRWYEIAWMLHRLLPTVQPPDVPLPAEWAAKWRILDESFEIMLCAMTHQLGKTVGASVVKFLRVKFPFNDQSSFPL